MKTPEQRGAFGNWLRQERARLSGLRGQSIRQIDMAAEIRAAGYPIRDDYYRAIESGAKRPGRETREALGRIFGSQPPMTEEPTSDLGELTAAIRAQTEAINRLVARLERGILPGVDQADLLEAAGELTEHLAGIPPRPHEAPPEEVESQDPAEVEPREQ